MTETRCQSERWHTDGYLGVLTADPGVDLENGAPEEIRTPDPQIRSLVLYPAELRARFSLGIAGLRP